MATSAGGGALEGAGAGFSYGGVIGAGVGALAGAYSGYEAQRLATRTRRRQRAAIQAAQQFADKRVSEITAAGGLFDRAKQFLDRSFTDAGNSAYAESVAAGIRSAQSTRGLFTGNLAAVQEAEGRGLAANQLQQQLAPLAQNFAFAPESLRQSILASQVPLSVAAATGGQIAGVGPSTLSSPFNAIAGNAIQGLTAGLNAANSFATPRSASPTAPPVIQEQQGESGIMAIIRRLLAGAQ